MIYIDYYNSFFFLSHIISTRFNDIRQRLVYYVFDTRKTQLNFRSLLDCLF